MSFHWKKFPVHFEVSLVSKSRILNLMLFNQLMAQMLKEWIRLPMVSLQPRSHHKQIRITFREKKYGISTMNYSSRRNQKLWYISATFTEVFPHLLWDLLQPQAPSPHTFRHLHVLVSPLLVIITSINQSSYQIIGSTNTRYETS